MRKVDQEGDVVGVGLGEDQEEDRVGGVVLGGVRVIGSFSGILQSGRSWSNVVVVEPLNVAANGSSAKVVPLVLKGASSWFSTTAVEFLVLVTNGRKRNELARD